MSPKIRQIDESEVIQAIVDDELVVRVNLDKMVACNLGSKAVNTIRHDFGNANYVYFIVEGGLQND